MLVDNDGSRRLSVRQFQDTRVRVRVRVRVQFQDTRPSTEKAW